MATYMITFRLKYDASYTDRWSSVVVAIRAQAHGGKAWEEMTATIILTSFKTADDLARDIYISSSFDATSDSLLVVNSSNNTYATRGQIDYPATLGSFFNASSDGLLGALMG